MEYRKLTELKKLPNNPRIIRDKQFKTLCDSIRDNPKYFEARPIILSNRTGGMVIIAGNQRYEAAKFLKLKEVPTFLIEGLDEAKEREIVIRDNISNGEFDMSALANEWSDLPLADWGVDLPEDWLNADGDAEVTEGDAEPQIDRAEELNKIWQVKRGDLFSIGEHRLLCGDSTKAEDVARVMVGEKAELCFTSPPYADMRVYSGNDLSLETIVKIFPIWRAFVEYFAINLGVQFKDGEIYEYWTHWIAAAKNCNLKFLSWNVWDRINGTSVSSQTKMFCLTHEWVFVFGDKPKELNRTWEKSEESKKREKYYTVNANGQKVTTRRQADGTVKDSVIGTIYDNKNMGSVFTGYAEMDRSIEHPAKFPIDFPAGYVGAMTDSEDIVCDPFLGSGSTMVACQNLNRKCRGIEISPAYCAVILQRMTDAFPGIEIKRLP